MGDFNKALAKTLQHEGGYVNDPTDMGGETYKGITMRSWPQWEGWAILAKSHLTQEDLATLDWFIHDLYHKEYWKPSRAKDIRDQAVAERLFDMCVNMGQGNAVRIIQHACSFSIPTTADGCIGPNTLKSINSIGKGLLNVIKVLHGAYYLKLIQCKPKQIKFINGWLKRAMGD